MAQPKILIWSKKHAAKAGFLVLFFIAFIGTVLMFAFMGTPKNPSDTTPVIADQTADINGIINTIHSNGYSGNTLFLKITLSITNFFKHVEAGGYYLTQAMSDWQIFQSLANPGMRYVTIAAGERKQEIADTLATALDWDTVEKREFVNANLDLGQNDLEGKYFPSTYLLPVNATPQDVAKTMVSKYDTTIQKLKAKYPSTVVNYDTALLIASIIQREAAGPTDMRLISGIIWNRIFRGMPLSLDATIQYAKGKTIEGWWAPINPSDIKEIESPYNTYKNKGLPPSPISNPSLAAIEAAINPQKTSCLFYIHDRYKQIHCSATGVGHEQNIHLYLQ